MAYSKTAISDNINKLYNEIINNNITIIKCYSYAEKVYYGTYPLDYLLPNIINILLSEIKTAKKHTILQVLLKLKNENKSLQTNVNVTYNTALLPNKYIYQSLPSGCYYYNNQPTLRVNYNNITNNISLKIIDKNISNVFFINDEKKDNEIEIDKNQLITPSIIITSIEKMYYWKKEILCNNEYNILKILIISANNQINNKININYYDIIIIRNDLFQNFIQINHIPNNNFIYNRIILDDIFIKTSYFNTFNYWNCLNIIIINRLYNNNNFDFSLSLPNKINVLHPLQYYNISYFHKILTLNKYLKSINKNSCIKDLSLINPRNILYNNVKINILSSNHNTNKFYENMLDAVKNIIEYYINDDLTYDFITNILKHINNDNNDNIINMVHQELHYYEHEYKTILDNLMLFKNDIIKNIYELLNNNDEQNILLIDLKNMDQYKYNENTMCFTTYCKYVEQICNNMTKNDEINTNRKIYIINKYKLLLNIINKCILNSMIYYNKIKNYLLTFNQKINQNVINNICKCHEKIECVNDLFYDMNDNIFICKKCSDANINDNVKILLNNETILNKKNKIETYVNDTFDHPISIDNHIIINEMSLNIKDMLIDLIKHLMNLKCYKILIYYNNSDDYITVQQKLINNDIEYKSISGINQNYDKIFDNLSNINENIILFQSINSIKLSIDYNNVDHIIFYNCIKKNVLYDHKFNEINRFISNNTNKTFYYLL